MSSLAMSAVGGAISACASERDIERLPVERGEYHVPVLADEVVALLSAIDGGVVIDATLGGGGHSALLLAANPTIRVLGIDLSLIHI